MQSDLEIQDEGEFIASVLSQRSVLLKGELMSLDTLLCEKLLPDSF